MRAYRAKRSAERKRNQAIKEGRSAASKERETRKKDKKSKAEERLRIKLINAEKN